MSHSKRSTSVANTPLRQERAASQLVRRLQEAGIHSLFGLPGGTIAPIFDAATQHGLRVITALHEGMAGYQALGHAHATGKPAVIAVTSGPGLLNLTTAAAAAREDEVPLIILSGEIATSHIGVGALQNGREDGLGVLRVFAPLCKATVSADTAEELCDLLAFALTEAASHPMGPVLLTLPVDLLEQPTRASEVRSEPIVRTACSQTLRSVATALSMSQRPVLWLGVGARAACDAHSLRAFAELHRFIVVSDLEAKGLFPESHPLSAGLVGLGSSSRAEQAVKNADFILTVGARMDPMTAGPVDSLRKTRGMVAHIDHSAKRLARKHGEALESDSMDGVLTDLGELAGLPASHLLVLRDAASRSLTTRDHAALPLDLAPHAPESVVRTLQRYSPKATFTSDIGNHLLAAARHLIVDEPDGFFVSYGLAGMTSGIGSAMGIALADPGRRVISICGDGGMLMCGTELATCAREGLRVTFAVFEDGYLGMVDDGMQADFGTCEVAKLPAVDLVAVARALGVQAHRVTDGRMLARLLRDGDDGPLLLAFPVVRGDAENPRIKAMQAMRAS